MLFDISNKLTFVKTRSTNHVWMLKWTANIFIHENYLHDLRNQHEYLNQRHKTLAEQN